MDYDAVVFDMDGVLVEMTPGAVLRDAARETFRDLGVDAPDPEHVDALRGGTTVDALREIGDAYDLDHEAVWERRERNAAFAQRALAHGGGKRPYEEVQGVLDALDLPMGVVSANQHGTVEFLMEHADLADHFGPIYGREETVAGLRRKKPNTHYLEVAFEELGAENPLYVGDSSGDVEAATAAGLDSAFVRRDHRLGYDLRAEPTYEVETLRAVPEIV